MTSHFDRIAEIYNRVWFFSASYQDNMVNNILSLLQLDSDDILVDIGGGTGAYTRLLLEKAGLKAAHCIEPSYRMYREAAKIPSITSHCADADEFMRMELNFTKVLLKEVVHHLPNRPVLWNYLYTTLPERGRVLLVTRPQATTLPLFEAATAVFRTKQPHHDVLLAELRGASFSTDVSITPFHFTLAKSSWCELIKHRFMSDLAGFSEEDIQQGLQEIDKSYPGEEIEILDEIIYILGKRLPP